jgi:hypothetical protein
VMGTGHAPALQLFGGSWRHRSNSVRLVSWQSFGRQLCLSAIAMPHADGFFPELPRDWQRLNPRLFELIDAGRRR